MIEPLRIHREKALTLAVEKPLFCNLCLMKKEKRSNPNFAVKCCKNCPKNNWLCIQCDDDVHRFGPAKLHTRRMIVLGPGLKKKVCISFKSI